MVNPTLFMLIISLVVSIAAAVGNIILDSARSCHLLWFVFFTIVSGAGAAAAFARLGSQVLLSFSDFDQGLLPFGSQCDLHACKICLHQILFHQLGSLS